MEDAHTHILSLPEDPATPFFGVYDGHGGQYFVPAAKIKSNEIMACRKLYLVFILYA